MEIFKDLKLYRDKVSFRVKLGSAKVTNCAKVMLCFSDTYFCTYVFFSHLKLFVFELIEIFF